MADENEIIYISDDEVQVVESEDDNSSQQLHEDLRSTESESGSDSEDESDHEWSTQDEPSLVEPGGMVLFGTFCTKLCEHIQQRVNSDELGYDLFFIEGGKVEVGLNQHTDAELLNQTPAHGVLVMSHTALSSRFHYQDETHWAKIIYTPMISQQTQTLCLCSHNGPKPTTGGPTHEYA